MNLDRLAHVWHANAGLPQLQTSRLWRGSRRSKGLLLESLRLGLFKYERLVTVLTDAIDSPLDQLHMTERSLCLGNKTIL